MVIGCPGSGKSWVCDQLKENFDYVHHDLFIGMAGDAYVNEILKRAESAKRPLLIEAPFSISQIKDPLERAGFEITPVFIQEDHAVISDRYRTREKKEIPKGHLTRQNTYLQRADEWRSFKGSSAQVLEHLKSESSKPPPAEGPWGNIADAIETPPDAMPQPSAQAK